MKTTLLISALLMTVNLFAAELPVVCTKVAEEAVKREASSIKYDSEAVYAFDCQLSSQKRVATCEVAAEKKGGAAVDSYRVTMEKNCRKAYKVELVEKQ